MLNSTVTPSDATNSSSEAPALKPYASAVGWAFVAVYNVIGALGIAGNFLSLVVFLGHKPLRRRPANYFLINQCAVNFSVSVLLVLTMTVDASHWPNSILGPMCFLWNSRAVFVGLFLSSLYNIALLTVERYLEIVHPIMYQVRFSRRKIVVSIVAGSLLGLFFKMSLAFQSVAVVNGVCITIPFSSVTIKRVNGVANVLLEYTIPLAVIAFCYAGMARSLQKSKFLQPSGGRGGGVGSKLSRARRNIVKMLFIVVVGFVACTSFKQFLLLMYFFADVGLDLNGYTFNVSQVLAYANCCNDPFIYAFHYDEFRVGLRRLFCRRRGKVTPNTDAFGNANSHKATSQ